MHLRPLVVAIIIAAMPIGGAMAGPASPYAGQEAREIKALSEAEVNELLAGKGMGFAKAAELNGYPGPAHVLELAAQLGLSEQQITQTRLVHARMEAEAKAAGAELIAAERELDTLFRTHSATPQRLKQILDRTGAAQARVREAHLRAHIEQTRLMSPAQIEQYKRLRGYRNGDKHSGHHHGQQKGHHDG